MSVFCFGSRQKGDERLFDGIRNKSLNQTKEALNCGANVNARDDNGFTPLHNAVKLQYVELVLLLLNNDANVNVQNERGSTPLNVAIFKNNIDVVLILLDRGALVNSKDEHGLTPLHKAVNLNREDIASLLLDRGALVNAEDENGFTPLHIAVNRDAGLLALTLLNRGAEVNARNKIKWTPLHEALNQSKFDLAYSLLDKGADVNAENDKGNTPLNVFHPRSWNANPKLLISLIPESDKLNKWDALNLANLIRICLGASSNNDNQIIELYSQQDFESFLVKAIIFRLGNVASNGSSNENLVITNILEMMKPLHKNHVGSMLKYFQNNLKHVCRGLSAIYPVLKARSSVPEYQDDTMMDEYHLVFRCYLNEVQRYFTNRRVKQTISTILCKTLNEEIYRRIFHDSSSILPQGGEELYRQGPFRGLPTELWFKIFEMSLGFVLDRELCRYDAFLSLFLRNSSNEFTDQIINEFCSKLVPWISTKELFDVLLLMPGEFPGPIYVQITVR